MRPRTIAAIVAIFIISSGVIGGYAITQAFGTQGTLAEVWVTDTARSSDLGNHHAPIAEQIRGDPLIITPVNSQVDQTSCALVAFNGSNNNLTRMWQDGLPYEDCNIHSFGDPTIADVDGDGKQEVLVATTEDIVLAYNTTSGEEEFRRQLAGWGYSAPIVTDFTSAEGRELIVADLEGGVFVFRQNGTTAWKQKLDGGVYARPIVDDFDTDGVSELIVGYGGDEVLMFEPNGTIVWRTETEGTPAWITTGNADGDKAPEIVAATTDGNVHALDSQDGSVMWTQGFGDLAAVHAFGDGDQDNQTEVYAVAEDGKLRALDASDGSIEWTTTLTTEDVQMMPPPGMADLDSDDDPELVAMSYDGSVSIINPQTGGTITSYERDVPLWMRPTFADVDGDGSQEILVVYGDGRVVALSYNEK